MTTVKRKNGEGTVRKIDAGIYEAVCQSSIPNPKTLKYKRFKRRGATAEGALSAAKMAMKEIDLQLNTEEDEENCLHNRKAFCDI